MNRQQLTDYVQAHTGKRLHSEQISLYISNGILTPDTSGHGAAHDYTITEADKLIRYMQALSIADAAALMSRRLGWHVTPNQVRNMCRADKIICIPTPNDFKIPLDGLDILANAITLSRQERYISPEYAKIAIEHAAQHVGTRAALARLCNEHGHKISPSGLHLVYHGKRRMENRALYNFLLSVPGMDLEGDNG
jgi:hypothetical protein